MRFSTALLAAVVLSAQVNSGDAPVRAPLTPAQRAAVDSLRKAYIVPSCGKPLAKCTQTCLIAAHLDTFLTWVAGVESTTTGIGRQLEGRHSALTNDMLASIDTVGYPILGNPHAPVSVVIYASSLCSLCKYVISQLLSAYDAAPWKKDVCIIAKPFGTAVGDKAVMAAHRVGKAWELERALANVKHLADFPLIMRIADSLKIDTLWLQRTMRDEIVAAAIKASREEGARNGVSVTPAVFINGHPYRSFKDPQWVIDAVEYAVAVEKAKKRK